MSYSLPINKCQGIYLGKVILHLAHGLLKVYVHGVYPPEWESKPELLPICMQMTPQFAGSNNGNGVFSYPNIGSTVVCVFANSDLNMPITLGSLLGGMNAFGLYEIIKNPDEPISERHLVTSGKSHIELYENGKISAIVVDPIRTDALVKYGVEPNSEISIDVVLSRELEDKVKANEISNINCQFVLDNSVNNGKLSVSTHWYNPLAKLSTTILSAEQITIMDSCTGEDKYDSFYSMDNIGNIDFQLTSAILYMSSYNVTNIPRKITELTIIPLTCNSSVHRYLTIDGAEGCDLNSQLVDAYAYTYVSQEKNELSSHNIKVDRESNISQKMPGNFLMIGKENQKIVEQYTNSLTGDSRTLNAKKKLENCFEATSDAQITISTLSTNNSTFIDAKALIKPHTNKHNASSTIVLRTEGGMFLNNSWKDDDLKNIGGNTIQVKEQNVAMHDFSIHPKIYSDLKIHHKQTKIVNGVPSKIDVLCQETMSPSDGKYELKIVNNLKKALCSILMDDSGNITIDASTSLTIKAPTVTILGETMTETFKSITTSATNINITGSAGDCKIKNVSLLNHVHQETQSGDVVSPQPTKSATASN